MTDIKLNYDSSALAFDLQVEDGDLALDLGLETATFISLFTDQRASEDDSLPGAVDDRRGWWRDIAGEYTNDRIGSKLWLLEREKTVASAAVRAEEYARDALKWMISSGLATKVDVIAEKISNDILGLHVRIHKISGGIEAFSYEYKWSS